MSLVRFCCILLTLPLLFASCNSESVNKELSNTDQASTASASAADMELIKNYDLNKQYSFLSLIKSANAILEERKKGHAPFDGIDFKLGMANHLVHSDISDLTKFLAQAQEHKDPEIFYTNIRKYNSLFQGIFQNEFKEVWKKSEFYLDNSEEFNTVYQNYPEIQPALAFTFDSTQLPEYQDYHNQYLALLDQAGKFADQTSSLVHEDNKKWLKLANANGLASEKISINTAKKMNILTKLFLDGALTLDSSKHYLVADRREAAIIHQEVTKYVFDRLTENSAENREEIETLYQLSLAHLSSALKHLAQISEDKVELSNSSDEIDWNNVVDNKALDQRLAAAIKAEGTKFQQFFDAYKRINGSSDYHYDSSVIFDLKMAIREFATLNRYHLSVKEKALQEAKNTRQELLQHYEETLSLIDKMKNISDVTQYLEQKVERKDLLTCALLNSLRERNLKESTGSLLLAGGIGSLDITQALIRLQKIENVDEILLQCQVDSTQIYSKFQELN